MLTLAQRNTHLVSPELPFKGKDYTKVYQRLRMAQIPGDSERCKGKKKKLRTIFSSSGLTSQKGEPTLHAWASHTVLTLKLSFSWRYPLYSL